MIIRIAVLEIAELGLGKIPPTLDGRNYMLFYLGSEFFQWHATALPMCCPPLLNRTPPNWIWVQVHILLLGLKQVLLRLAISARTF